MRRTHTIPTPAESEAYLRFTSLNVHAVIGRGCYDIEYFSPTMVEGVDATSSTPMPRRANEIALPSTAGMSTRTLAPTCDDVSGGLGTRRTTQRSGTLSSAR